MDEAKFQERIGYAGDIEPVLQQVCADFDLGDYQSHKVLTVGYEDFNLILTTKSGKFFVKIFATFRDAADCERYMEIMTKVLEAGVRMPKLIKSNQGYLYQLTHDGVGFRLCVMEYIDGESYYDLKAAPSLDEARRFAAEAAKINAIDYKPEFVFDNWAIVNFPKQYTDFGQYLTNSDRKLIESLVSRYQTSGIDTLPKCLVHGDIIKTNALKAKDGNIYIVDFAVANEYPRIVELAVLLCNLLFDENNLDSYPSYYNAALDEYQMTVKLNKQELAALPFMVQVAHAMHIIGATREQAVNQNDTDENKYWLNLGRVGLEYTSKLGSSFQQAA